MSRILKKRVFSLILINGFGSFSTPNKAKNEMQDHILILREKAHRTIPNMT
jgi:hypothetical protein